VETITLFENGHTQLLRFRDGTLVVCVSGRDWYYPTSLIDGIEKMLKRDWDETIAAFAELITEANE
jgi:hypothetical protein